MTPLTTAEIKNHVNGHATERKSKQNSAAPPESDSSNANYKTLLPNNFRLRTNEGKTGVFYVEGKEETRICSPLKILAATRDRDGGEWGVMLEFADPDGRIHTWAMPRRLLAGDGNELRATLLSLGLEITPTRKAKDLLGRYLLESKPQSRIRCVSTIGWHGDCFVLPDKTFGDTGKDRVIFQTESLPEHRFYVSGSVAGWRERVAKCCTGNTRLLFAVSAAFAAVLLPIVDEQGGGFHFRGDSSLGKSTLLLVSGSAAGGGGKDGFLESWRTTANGLEAVGAMHNHSLLCLDEIKECDPRTVGETAYMLGNGQGKRRMTRDGSMRRRLEWNLIFLSSGEIGLSSLVEQNGGRVYGGQEVRMCEIKADSGKFGVFENLHEFASGDALATELRINSKQFYGSAVQSFLGSCVAADKNSLREEWRTFNTKFSHEALPPGAGGEVSRVCRRFALIAFAGEMANAITGWNPGEAANAAKSLFETWLENRQIVGSSDLENAIRQVRLFLELHGASRFQDAAAEDQIIYNRAGFRREHPRSEGFQFLILPETFKKEVCKGFDARQAADEMQRRGWLETGHEGKQTQSVYIGALKKTQRVYVVNAAALDNVSISLDDSAMSKYGL